MAASISRLPVIGAILAAVLVAAGVVLWVIAPSTDASFGWFAYAPLADGVSMGPVFLDVQQLLAAGLVVAGLIITGVALGFRWGHGVGRSEKQSGPDLFSHPASE